jgi:hypothetical protein
VPKSSVQLEVVVAEDRNALIQPKGLHTYRQEGGAGEERGAVGSGGAAISGAQAGGGQARPGRKERRDVQGLTQCATTGYTNMTIMSSYSM